MIPENWNEWEPFRATLLFYFTPEHAATLQQLGGLLCELALLPEYQEQLHANTLPSRLRAAAADLRFLAGFLAVQGAQQTESILTPEEIALAQRAATLGREVARLAGEMEEALAGG